MINHIIKTMGMKTVRYILVLLSCFLCAFPVMAQPGAKADGNPVFIGRGKIQFEKKTNMHKTFGDDMPEEFKSQVPKYKTVNYEFAFSGPRSYYHKSKNNEERGGFADFSESENKFFADHEGGKFVNVKSLFEKNFQIEDSLGTIQWKITNETRVIAGFNCRRATTILYDSIYIIAFYTDEILISGGPETFHGLPGMILGVVVPRVHSTWFATKVELDVKETEIQPVLSSKNEKVSLSTYRDALRKLSRNWGEEGERYLWRFYL